MRLLVITHDYPPILSPRASRWGTIVGELIRRGHQVELVCGWVPGECRAEECPPGLRIRRVGGGFIGHLRRRLGGGPQYVRSGEIQDAGMREHAGPGAGQGRSLVSIRRGISTGLRGLWRSVYWPDAWCGFIWPAWRQVRRIVAERPPDALITVSYPFSSHIPGLWLKRRYPELPWLVDIGDPFALFGFPNNQRLYRRLNLRAESAVVAAADRISVTNRGAREHYLANFHIDEDRIEVIDPILPDFPGAAAAAMTDDRRPAREDFAAQQPSGTQTLRLVRGDPLPPLRLVYCGQLYRHIRNPQPLLRLLEALVRDDRLRRPIELHLYGGLGDCGDLFGPFEPLLGRHLFLHGSVSRGQALQAMQCSDVLVNLGNATPHQVPSKVVDYLGTGKPILNLITRVDDLSCDLLAGYPAALTLDVAGEGLEQQADRALGFLRQLPKKLEGPAHAALVERFLPQTITAAYLASIARSRKAA